MVASVQWLFAAEMRAKYRLPFDAVERRGLPLYDDFIAVSDWLAAQIQARRPAALVETIPNGVEALAFAAAAAPPSHFVFVGRLDIAQKGCDLLLESLAQCAAELGPALPPLIIVGDGPDQARLMSLVQSLGLAGRVEFRGRVSGAAKYALMASAHAVLMPSRFETFGMVAVEAQAAGAPVIAFDVGPLREVAGAGGALLVPPFDTAAFAAAMLSTLRAPDHLAGLRAQGRQWAQRYRWDALAAQQAAHYARAVARHERAQP